MDEYKAIYAQPKSPRTLAEVLVGADIFLGLSAGGILKPEMLDNGAEADHHGARQSGAGNPS